jgi:antitoxin (DNA-binding transcriptional repressor) of toxin-antitoxin stability system
MRSTSLVNAKAHLSELVEAAEYGGKKVLILRHDKSAAALTRAQAERRLDAHALALGGDPTIPAVEDLIVGRR